MVEYINEHIYAGHLGRALVCLAFVGATMSILAGYFATKDYKKGLATSDWSKYLGWGFGIKTVSIISIIVLLLTMMTNHWYEYQYVQQHVNDELPFKYVFTAFWEGQEGSFLLWLFWQSILGMVVWFSSKKWRAPVLTIVASVQLVLLSMILGVYLPFGDELRIGSSPFLLLRETMDIPLFAQADYISLIEGTGLNPLLQNYWMIIHPPTLFLGFGSVVIPFAFAMSGLWLNEHKAWLKPVLYWTLFSSGILGIGILMGGAWAYEALNFGGYWAWDPVENSSLVPWLLLIAGLHTNLIARATGHSIKSTYSFYALAFVAVCYSSFLTRSGILGESSVHAFTEMGLENQLLFLVLAFLVLFLAMLAYRWKSIPTKQKEESITSKEFWMFLGSLILLFSSIMLIVSTSLPVFNKISTALSLDIEPMAIKDPVTYYNKYQIWIAVFMAIFTAIGQYLQWKGFRTFSGQRRRSFLIRIGISLLLAIGLTVITYQNLDSTGIHLWLFAFAAYFTAFSNLDYLFRVKLPFVQKLGSVSSHFGFGVMLIGILFSGINKHHISKNTFAMDGLLGEEQIGKNVLLVKGLPMVINGYEVTYLSDSLDGNRRDYHIRYKTLSATTGETGQEFVLSPYALYTNDFSKVASMNPDTKHYLDHDVFTHITGLPPGVQSADLAKAFEDSLQFEQIDLAINNSTNLEKHKYTLLSLSDAPTHPDYSPVQGDLALGAKIKIERLDFDTVEYAEPVIVLRENLIFSYPDQVNPLSVRAQLTEEALMMRYGDESKIPYKEVVLAPDQNTNIDGFNFTFNRFVNKGSHPAYQAQEGDVSVNAVISVKQDDKSVAELKPLFYIRENQPGQLKDYDSSLGLHARLIKIDPSTGKAHLALAVAEPMDNKAIPIEIAENASRNDWVVLEATVFPGINLFWVGSILMLLGLLISWVYRLSTKKALKSKSQVPYQQPNQVEKKEHEPIY